MDEKATPNLPDGRSFEERVFARFDALQATINVLQMSVNDLQSKVSTLQSAVQDIDVRLQKLEARAYDTKLIWERALKEILETRRELSKRLDRIEAVAHETRADVRDAEDRIERLESKPIQ